MKKLFQKSGALVMAFLVLFSTMSFTVDKHFCGKVLMGQSVLSEVEACCSNMHSSSDDGITDKDGCCSDKEVAVEGQNELKTCVHSFDFQQLFTFTAFVYTYLDLYEGLPEQVVPFKNYSPPLLVSDILVLDQTFLI